jgi:WD40 repeat protein
MHSHFEGEVWGLDVSQYPSVYTSGDDNQVCVWDVSKRKIQKSLKFSDRNVTAKAGGASTLSKMPAS